MRGLSALSWCIPAVAAVASYSGEAHACVYQNIYGQQTADVHAAAHWVDDPNICGGPVTIKMYNRSQNAWNWFAWEMARQNWNQHTGTTGITIEATASIEEANITAGDYEDHPDADGVANISAADSFGCAYMIHAWTYLNVNKPDNTDFDTIYGSAVHELGHALGLGHEDGICVTMDSSSARRAKCVPSVVGLTPHDAACVAAMYPVF